MRAPNETKLPLRATPALERLLARLRRQLRGKIWLHGVGTLLVAVGAWLVFSFFSDWALHVPKGVRWFHLLVLIALPLAVAWRELARHFARVPDRAGLALLVERAQPAQDELLVSAVQLQESADPDGDPALVARVLAAADTRAAGLSLQGVLDGRGPRRRFASGAALAAALLAVSLAQPTYSAIFLRRLFGQEVPWPQLTWLTLSIPNLSDKAQIQQTEELIEVRVARGTDVPVLVRAKGRVPDDVTLHFEAGHKAVLGSSGDGIFRTLLRSCQEDLSFHVTGGDDRGGRPRVVVVVLDPPDISGLAVRVEPPAYTGLASRVEFDSDVAVPAGSRVSVSVLPDPPAATGSVRLLPDDRELALVAADFPDPAGAARPGLGFELEVTESLRYRFEIEDDSGLSNPDPGLFAIHVLPDREPQVEVLAPGRTEVDTVAGGTLSLRVRAEDDFGLRALAWSVRAASEDTPRLAALEFESSLAAGEGGDPGDPARPQATEVAAAERVEVAALAASGGGDLAGEQFLLDVRALDNRPGNGGDDAGPLDWAADDERPGVGRSSTVRVRVLSADEFLRRLQDRLARLRLSVTELEELQRQKSQRTRELIASLESDDPELGTSGGELSAALSGQRRVQGDAEAAARELAAILESVLYARVDEKAGGLLEDLDGRLARSPSRSFQAEVWAGLVADWRAAQTSSAPGLADQLVRLFGLSLDISTGNVAEAAAALDLATRAVDLAGVHEHLLLADRHQTAARAEIEELLGLLGEWDNFQSILTLTRDILSRQKALRDRTREQARDK